MSAALSKTDDDLGNSTNGRLSKEDLEKFAEFRISPELLERNGVERVSHEEWREKYEVNLNGSGGDYAGIVFPYHSRQDGHLVSARLRRDNPPIEAGKPKHKYHFAYGNRPHLYFVSGVNYNDPDARIVLVEAEKSALALTAFADRVGVKIAPIAMGGCYGWRGRIGKIESANGQRVDEKGPLPDLEACRGRQVIVMLDSNVVSKPYVWTAERGLIATLSAIDAKILIARVPAAEGVNGPDDLIVVMGDDIMRRTLDSARPSTETALDDAKLAVAAVKGDKHNTDLLKQALDAVAAIPDTLQREAMQAELAAATGRVISGGTIRKEILVRLDKQKKASEEWRRQISEAELLSRSVNARQLIAYLERFFSERVYLSEGAGLLFAYYAMNTHTYELFDSTPYLDVESATKRCGKTTVLTLLEAVCARAFRATSLSGAYLFRKVDEGKGTILFDEAEVFEDNSDRGKELRMLCLDGYKKGAKTGRVNGENRDQLREFDIYGPKVFALIGGLSGPLLDRSIVVHQERAPRGHKRKSSRVRPLKRAAAPLIEQLSAYAVQARPELTRIYDEEPDEGYWEFLEDREAEIFGPLLYHAKMIGSDAEQALVKVVKRFMQAKAEIEAEDPKTAKAIVVLECLEAIGGPNPKPDATFAPVDLVDRLAESDVWSPVFAKAKGIDEEPRRKWKAQRVGYFLKDFRLKKAKGTHRIEYNLQNAIDIIRAYTPQKPSEASEPSESTPQDIENNGVGKSDTFAEALGNEHQNHRQAKDCERNHEKASAVPSAQVSAPQVGLDSIAYDTPDSSEGFRGRRGNINSDQDYLFDAAVARCREIGHASVTDLMAEFVLTRIQAIRYVDQIERLGLVGPANGKPPCE